MNCQLQNKNIDDRFGVNVPVPESMSDAVRDAIAKRRIEIGMSQDSLAEKAKTQQATISNYLLGKQQIELETLKRIVKALGGNVEAEASIDVSF